jgi:hypothetical protein
MAKANKRSKWKPVEVKVHKLRFSCSGSIEVAAANIEDAIKMARDELLYLLPSDVKVEERTIQILGLAK